MGFSVDMLEELLDRLEAQGARLRPDRVWNSRILRAHHSAFDGVNAYLLGMGLARALFLYPAFFALENRGQAPHTGPQVPFSCSANGASRRFKYER